jgi:steroid delta-isomerase-like uncharacterized protein
MSSDREGLEAVTRRWISLWCPAPDWSLFDRIHADDFEDGSSAGRGTSKQAFAAGLAKLIAAFPDLRTEVEDLVIDEPSRRVAVRWSAVGTNRLEYLGVGPTHRRVRITGIEIIEIAEGRIRRRWGEWDITDHTATR